MAPLANLRLYWQDFQMSAIHVWARCKGIGA